MQDINFTLENQLLELQNAINTTNDLLKQNQQPITIPDNISSEESFLLMGLKKINNDAINAIKNKTQLVLSRQQILKINEYLVNFNAVEKITLVDHDSSKVGKSVVIHMELNSPDTITVDLTDYSDT
jgi:hypothetical protein